MPACMTRPEPNLPATPTINASGRKARPASQAGAPRTRCTYSELRKKEPPMIADAPRYIALPEMSERTRHVDGGTIGCLTLRSMAANVASSPTARTNERGGLP